MLLRVLNIKWGLTWDRRKDSSMVILSFCLCSCFNHFHHKAIGGAGTHYEEYDEELHDDMRP